MMEIELRQCVLNRQPLTVRKAYLSISAGEQPDPWKVLLIGPNAISSAVLYDAMSDGAAAFAGVTVDGERVMGQVNVRRVLHGQNAELGGIGALNGA